MKQRMLPYNRNIHIQKLPTQDSVTSFISEINALLF